MKVKATVHAASQSKAVLMDASENLKIAQHAAQLTHDELIATKRAQLDGTKHWEHLQTCTKVRRIDAKKYHLHKQIKDAVGAAQRYQEKAAHFKQIIDTQTAAEGKAQLAESRYSVSTDRMHQRLLKVSQKADMAWKRQKVLEEERDSWASQAKNALGMEKGLLEKRADGAQLELGEAQKTAAKQHDGLQAVQSQLVKSEAILRHASRQVFQHSARAKAAKAEYETLEAKAKRESERGERLQIELDRVS